MLVDLIIATCRASCDARFNRRLPHSLAVRLTGKFKTAFPEGKPSPTSRRRKSRKGRAEG
jgi:hypothetical protein